MEIVSGSGESLVKVWDASNGDFMYDLVDPDLPKKKYSTDCRAATPPGATCSCDCVCTCNIVPVCSCVGEIYICTCVPVCICIPVWY